MRKWKDNEVVKIKHSKLYLIGAGFLIFMALLDFTIFKSTWQDYFSMGLGLFIIWGIKGNGIYKINRKITELILKRRDNKFRYFHT